jgi:hypothetical protein
MLKGIMQLACFIERENEPYIEGLITHEESFWRSLIFDRNQEGIQATSADAADFGSRIKHRRPLSIDEHGELRQRTFLVTETGLIGIGPANCCTGDFVVVIPGCSVPLMLRQSQGKSTYHLVGECCIANPTIDRRKYTA